MRLLPAPLETLWTLFTAPIIWGVHFLACYVGAAVYCAKHEQLAFGFEAVRAAIAVGTVLALALISLSAWLAWRQWGFGSGDPPHDQPTRLDRTLFQGFATLLLSGLCFIGVIYVALPALFISECIR